MTLFCAPVSPGRQLVQRRHANRFMGRSPRPVVTPLQDGIVQRQVHAEESEQLTTFTTGFHQSEPKSSLSFNFIRLREKVVSYLCAMVLQFLILVSLITTLRRRTIIIMTQVVDIKQINISIKTVKPQLNNSNSIFLVTFGLKDLTSQRQYPNNSHPT